MARKKRSRAPTHPGGPGAMAALKRAQEKLKAMGIKLYKWSPPEPKSSKKAPPAAADAIESPKSEAGAKGAPSAAKPTAGGARASTAKAGASARPAAKAASGAQPAKARGVDSPRPGARNERATKKRRAKDDA